MMRTDEPMKIVVAFAKSLTVHDVGGTGVRDQPDRKGYTTMEGGSKHDRHIDRITFAGRFDPPPDQKLHPDFDRVVIALWIRLSDPGGNTGVLRQIQSNRPVERSGTRRACEEVNPFFQRQQ